MGVLYHVAAMRWAHLCGGRSYAESALTHSEVKSDQLILDTLYCYRTVWKYWEREYQILDSQIESINQN
ncbi:MAG: hypothetical protein IH823_07975 [Candidatus Dadabacteria bacterium]|nr:hypothetical protein [Candidatus Dadabacteria bacterium]